VATAIPAPDAMAPGGSRVAIDRVRKIFGQGPDAVTAVDDVSLDIAPGEFVVLLGPSGCGKTTLLRMIGGLETPTSGTVSIAAERGSGGVANAFQDPRLFPWLTVADNVSLPLRLRGRPAAERRRRARELCALVGLTGFEDVRPTTLSGGMKQRAAIARALSIEPSTLLLDEPFGALDAMTRDQMNLELQRIWMTTGATVVLVTHSIAEAVFLGDRIVLLSPRPGRIHRIYDVPFARARDIDVQTGTEFQEIVREIRRELNGFGP
jgi:NitT/TauT family transport system ATP-binding protein